MKKILSLHVRFRIRVSDFLKGLKWLSQGALIHYYEGFNCGCCGKWWSIPFVVPDFQSDGEWADTWGLCPKDKGCREGESAEEEKQKRKQYNEHL